MASHTLPHKTSPTATKTMAAFNALYQKARHETQHRSIMAQWLSEPVNWELLVRDVKNALTEQSLDRNQREIYRLILAEHNDPAAVDEAFSRYEDKLASLRGSVERQHERAEAIRALVAENQAIREEIGEWSGPRARCTRATC